MVIRLLYVPCTEVVRTAIRGRPEILRASVLPLWRVGTESVRYDLIFFQEVVLLLAAAGVYGAIFTVRPDLRPKWLCR